MKSAVVALALAGAAVAQNLSGEPACASSCLISAISAAGCAADDVSCQCGPTETAIASLVAPCLISNCHSAAELIQAQSAGYALCSAYSKTAGAPASASATATSGSATTGSGSSTAATTTVTTTSASGSLTTTTKTSSSSSSRGIGSNATVTTGTKTTTKGGASGTGPSTTQSTAGAATLGAGVLAAFIGLMAAL
ncbi:hypothetical protein Sste5346_005479 [Sporothrix stenoceras]|uniref:CFEM domain-containing protein n=1 Tax=Sporothrix stenoceras TaxID=5173 RepID=A0ABR3Z4B1_9PEZI